MRHRPTSAIRAVMPALPASLRLGLCLVILAAGTASAQAAAPLAATALVAAPASAPAIPITAIPQAQTLSPVVVATTVAPAPFPMPQPVVLSTLIIPAAPLGASELGPLNLLPSGGAAPMLPASHLGMVIAVAPVPIVAAPQPGAVVARAAAPVAVLPSLTLTGVATGAGNAVITPSVPTWPPPWPPAGQETAYLTPPQIGGRD